jgi:hypothetical protein
MMREREMRGFRADSNCPLVVVVVRSASDRSRSGLWVPVRVVAASAEAAAVRELGFTGGGITACLGDSNSGVVNILSFGGGEPVIEFPPPPRGLFVMASSTALCGGVLAR